MTSRYYIHISSNENRESILEQGLIPRSIMDSNQFDKEHREQLHGSLDEPKIFAMPIGDDLDVYDMINITSSVFPIPMVAHGFSEEEYDDIANRARAEVNYDAEVITIKNRYEKSKGNNNNRFVSFGAQEDYEELNNRLGVRVNKLLVAEAKNFDIWLIDNEIAKCEWEEDPNGYDDTVGSEAYMTNKAIPIEALDLISQDNKSMRGEVPFEKMNHLISFDKFIK